MRGPAATNDKDRFGDLTDDILRQVLSFLPPDEALQTCVLDTRWRNLWRRTTNLVLIFDDERSRLPVSENMQRLAKLIIQLRGNLPLSKCEIHACPDDAPEWTYTHTRVLIDAPEWTYTSTRLLIGYAITCQANELIVRPGDAEYKSLCFQLPFISQHLKSIELEWVSLRFSALDFSGCPVLEDLKMLNCRIHAYKISSKTLKRLCITDSCTIPDYFRIRICAPGLISLKLNDFDGLTPFLDYMPFLVTAYVRLGYSCYDFCRRHLQGCDSPDSDCHARLVKDSVLLNGLSNVVDLELIDRRETLIYRWDLKWCPIFNELKTLLLNEWFTAIDLLCILQHAPVIEMLTLQLGNTKKLVRATRAQETIEPSFVCSHLKVVNIKCTKVDEGIFIILKILSTCGILREQISIEDPCSRSDHFSFQKPPHSFYCSLSCSSSHQ